MLALAGNPGLSKRTNNIIVFGCYVLLAVNKGLDKPAYWLFCIV